MIGPFVVDHARRQHPVSRGIIAQGEAQLQQVVGALGPPRLSRALTGSPAAAMRSGWR